MPMNIFQAEVISPSEELVNNQVVNDFDIEEDEIQIENRYCTCKCCGSILSSVLILISFVSNSTMNLYF